MPRARLESFAVTKLSIHHDGDFLGPATGFFYRFGQDVALVTNWHVLSGMNPITRKFLHSRGLAPTRIEFNINILAPDKKSISIQAASIQLNSTAGSNWWQHKGYEDESGSRQIVDIGVLQLQEHLDGYDAIRSEIIALHAHVLVNTDSSGAATSIEHGYPRVGADVFILGFPRGLSKQGVFPIWKRGSIASEPLFFVLDGAPAMLVDAITREGMSGSPVLYFGGDFTDATGSARSGFKQDDPWLIGVYAGREGVTEDEVEMTLGRVWQRSMLDAIFIDEHRERGSASLK